MSLAERLASQLKKKEQGNALFRRGEFERALRRYEAPPPRHVIWGPGFGGGE